MTADNDRIKATIRKLLALHENDAAMWNEIDNSIRLARKLMLAHNLSEEEVRADAEAMGPAAVAAAVAATEYGQACTATMSAGLSGWESLLLAAIGALVGTVKHYDAGKTYKRGPGGVIVRNPENDRPRYARTITFYGPKDDAADACALFDEWSVTVAALARMKYDSVFHESGRDYSEGFARALLNKALAERAKENARVAEIAVGGRLDVALLAGGTQEQKAMVLAERGGALALGNALALMDAKREGAKEWLKKALGIKLVSSSRGGAGMSDAGAYAAGRADGARAGFAHRRTPKLGGGA